MLVKVLMGLIALSVIAPYVIYRATGKTKGKECLLMNAITFFSAIGIGVVYSLGCAAPAFAAGEASAALSVGDGLRYIGMALSTGLSGIGGGVAVASAASAAIGAMSENEKIMGKTLIFVALAEGIALYGLVISILIMPS
ncbi:MAG: ATP synthase subunit C [Clostridia bacterium]